MDKLISTCCEGTVERIREKTHLYGIHLKPRPFNNNPRPTRPFTRAISQSPQTKD